MNKNTATEGFDFSQYIVLQPRQGRADSRRIYIRQDNELHLNGKFMNSIDLEKHITSRYFCTRKKIRSHCSYWQRKRLALPTWRQMAASDCKI